MRRLLAIFALAAATATAQDAAPLLMVMGGDWMPRDLGGLVLWMDADDKSTLFANSSRAATTNGGFVFLMDDKSGWGNTASAVATNFSQSPIRQDATLNGRTTLRFNGGQWLVNTSYSGETSRTGLARFVVYKVDTTTGNQITHWSGAARPAVQQYNDGVNRLYSHFGPDNVYGRIANSTATNSPLQVGEYGIAACVLNGAEAAGHDNRIRFHANGGAKLTWDSTSGTVPDVTGTDRTYALSSARVTMSPLAPMTGNIAEVIVYNTALSDADRQKVEGYLAHKWGLTAKLPADHPYKSDPPKR